MKQSISNEFFYFNSGLGEGPHDFTNLDIMPFEQRMEYLSKYAEHLEKAHNIPEIPKKVVTEEETAAAMEALTRRDDVPQISKRLSFDVMNASLKPVTYGYEGWSLYTKKAFVEEKKVVFDGPDYAPTPSASYTFDNSKRLKEFEFSFVMDSEYAAPIMGVIIDTTPGRTVELRCGIQDLVKIQFYSSGVYYARLGKDCPYHLKNVLLGEFEFDKVQHGKITLYEDTFTFTFNGVTSEPLPLDVPDVNPDTVYIGTGMFRIGRWEFTPEKMAFEDETKTEFFITCGESDAPAESLGEVTMPYVVGTYANKDKALCFEKTFEIKELQTAILHVQSLDPGGKVWVNGMLVADTDRFESMKLDITDNLKMGENLLQIQVDPRGPEVLFNWHRQKDAYNGWFCEEVWIDFFQDIRIDDVIVVPEKLDGAEMTNKITAAVSKDCEVKIYMRKTNPVAEAEENFLGNYQTKDGKLDATFTVTPDLWTPENPNLYVVRVVALNADGNEVDDAAVETGFRTIEQRDGDILLNGEKIVLTGALTMQFLPPYWETPVTHICPWNEQIVWQELMVKEMCGNTLRMHILGYGSNDARYARIADKLGLMLIWTTRYLDSVEQMVLQDNWAMKDGFLQQIQERMNHPSIIMWEGSNEFHPCLSDIDRICDEFVPAVKAVDMSRIICPISHLYYAGDMIPLPNCGFYNDAGTADHAGNPMKSTENWTDPMVIRSAHTYGILLGYGTKWDRMRTQKWTMQKEMVESKDHAYIVSEFAVIGRQNPDTPEAKKYFNEYSYEFADERASGMVFTRDQWRQSQAYQALAAKVDVQMMRLEGIDGMLWCCLLGGANDAGYLKPPIDCYGYPKLAFYTLKEGYQNLYVATNSVDVIKGTGFELTPVVFGAKAGERYGLKAVITNEAGDVVAEHTYEAVTAACDRADFAGWKPELSADGYYAVRFELAQIM